MINVFGRPQCSTGPRTCRSRSPWPCRPKLRPGSRLARPQQGHDAGRTSSTDGTSSIQCLKSRSQRTSLIELRSFIADGRSTAGRCANTSRHLLSAHLAPAPFPFDARPTSATVSARRSPRDGTRGVLVATALTQPDRNLRLRSQPTRRITVYARGRNRQPGVLPLRGPAGVHGGCRRQ